MALACDRVAVMNNGEIVEVESVDKLNQTESAFQKLFTSEEKEMLNKIIYRINVIKQLKAYAFGIKRYFFNLKYR